MTGSGDSSAPSYADWRDDNRRMIEHLEGLPPAATHEADHAGEIALIEGLHGRPLLDLWPGPAWLAGGAAPQRRVRGHGGPGTFGPGVRGRSAGCWAGRPGPGIDVPHRPRST